MMIKLVGEADVEYGRRLREELEDTEKSGSSMNPLGAKDTEQASKQAIEKDREAESL